MSSPTTEEPKLNSSSYFGIMLMVIVTHIIFSCCVYGIWTATGDMMKSDWFSCFSKITIVGALLVPFATSKAITLNRLFDRF